MVEPKTIMMVAPEFYGQTMVGGLAMAVHGLSHALADRNRREGKGPSRGYILGPFSPRRLL